MSLSSLHAKFNMILIITINLGQVMRKCVMSYANNKGAVHLCILISTFVVRCLDSTTPLVVILEISRLHLASVAEQAGLNLTWSKIPEDMFSHDVGHSYLCMLLDLSESF